MTEDEMVGWQHRLMVISLSKFWEVGGGQGSLACCSPWDYPVENTGVGCHCLLHAPTLGASVQFSCSVVSYSLQPDGLQHIRPPCPSPVPRVYLNSSPLSW